MLPDIGERSSLLLLLQLFLGRSFTSRLGVAVGSENNVSQTFTLHPASVTVGRWRVPPCGSSF